ncbi:hypothetical protein GCM10011514_06380 [Emticicia aquatilis]|uniref:Uncharacterized protein n=1 Tax=Emticicia aquatilis TaxID=1537369 RepID=A0A916YH76_9BACT|nr:hypothetical protein [Emticicia aquatilis]GGD45066.1 hypothetical protein GCM10011514_06380 [Emticicia aquatilis]
MQKSILEEKNELPDGVYLSHLVTKKVETKHRRLFFELFNNTEFRTPEGVLYLDLRTILGVKVKLLSVETNTIKPRERCVFYIDVEQYVARFKKIGWFLYPLYAEVQTTDIHGECKNSGKEEDLVAYGKKIDNLKKK